MARGKPSLASTVNPEEIVYSGEIRGDEPNIILPDAKKNYNYGIFVTIHGYNLAILKDGHRTEKDENNNARVIHYQKWEEIGYFGTFESAFYRYVDLVIKSKDAQLRKCNSIQELISIRKEVKSLVSETFPQIVDKTIKKDCALIQEYEVLKQQVQDARSLLLEAKSAHDELINLIKEKRRIILQETEPKKHCLKLEE